MFQHRRFACLVLAGCCWLSVFCDRSLACLRANLDDRAVQWSTLIVQAKYLSSATRTDDGGFTLHEFEVTDVLDGAAKVGDHVQVIHFAAEQGDAASLCDQKLKAGKSYILLLIPEEKLVWSRKADVADPRTAQTHDLKAFAIVHLDSVDDLGKEGLADAKYTIHDTRAAEAAFNADNAKTQVQTLINAADDTEAGDAQHALLEMGPKALDILKAALDSAGDVGRARLRLVVDALSPPPITRVQVDAPAN